jgi:hypothetical protein
MCSKLESVYRWCNALCRIALLDFIENNVSEVSFTSVYR